MNKQQLLHKILSAPSRNSRPYIWMEYLKNAPENSKFLEFGVWNGRSINYMADARPDCSFYGFDSFEGLPENWIHPKGYFKTDPGKIIFKQNITIHPGLFSDTIHHANMLPNIYGIHIDCDLGSSTKTVLDNLTNKLVEYKSLILFDELIGYTGYEEHEFLALLNWSNDNKIEFDVVARNASHQQVLIKIL